MIKLIATDMDGTFLDNKKQFDKSFIDLFFEMKEQGVLFVAASGNQYVFNLTSIPSNMFSTIFVYPPIGIP